MYAAHEIYIGTEVPKEVMVGIEKMQQYFRVTENSPWGPNTARWMISPNCVNLTRELKKLRWAEYESQKKQYEMNRQETVHKKDDHGFDSMRYLASLMPDLAPEVQLGPIYISLDTLTHMADVAGVINKPSQDALDEAYRRGVLDGIKHDLGGDLSRIIDVLERWLPVARAVDAPAGVPQEV
jgi:hypothetical protein